MPKLPNAEQCVIPGMKLSGYLLDPSHPDGGPKARFLARFGFDVSTLEALKSALLDHAKNGEVITERDTEFGPIYAVEGALQTPDGRNPIVRVVWMIDVGRSEPRLITLVPDRGSTND